MKNNLIILLLCVIAAACSQRKPNVILIMTDDQGDDRARVSEAKRWSYDYIDVPSTEGRADERGKIHFNVAVELHEQSPQVDTDMNKCRDDGKHVELKTLAWVRAKEENEPNDALVSRATMTRMLMALSGMIRSPPVSTIRRTRSTASQ